jgi:hypothetical protein
VLTADIVASNTLTGATFTGARGRGYWLTDERLTRAAADGSWHRPRTEDWWWRRRRAIDWWWRQKLDED